MHVAKLILNGICAAMAVLAGVFAAFVALVGIGVVMLLRLFGQAATRRTSGPVRATGWKRRGETIDVTATEVRDSESEPEVSSPPRPD